MANNDWTKYLQINCRTCAHSTATPDSEFTCARHDDAEVPVDYQRTGCEGHVLHPDLVPWQIKEGPDAMTAVYVIDGKDVANGEPNETTFTSKEILANPATCANPDRFVQEMREIGGRVIG